MKTRRWKQTNKQNINVEISRHFLNSTITKNSAYKYILNNLLHLLSIVYKLLIEWNEDCKQFDKTNKKLNKELKQQKKKKQKQRELTLTHEESRVKHDTKAKVKNLRLNIWLKMRQQKEKRYKQTASCQQYGFINLSLSFKCWD